MVVVGMVAMMMVEGDAGDDGWRERGGRRPEPQATSSRLLLDLVALLSYFQTLAFNFDRCASLAQSRRPSSVDDNKAMTPDVMIVERRSMWWCWGEDNGLKFVAVVFGFHFWFRQERDWCLLKGIS
ncbi:hypothetical protein Droror1_Dr00013636 [Drosera rotundifolia]